MGWEQRATTDPDRIRRGWSQIPFNVGIATGPSNLVVIDLDMPKPGQVVPPKWAGEHCHHGADVFAVICEHAGKPMPVDTYTVTTGSGGTHLYYQHPTGPALRNTQGDSPGSLGWLIDTRAHGGYIVGAGSVVAGRSYTMAWDPKPAQLPCWIAQRLTPQPLPPTGPVTVELNGQRHTRYVDAAIKRTITRLTSVTSGRNHAQFMAAQTLGQLVAGGALDQTHVETVLTQAACCIGLHHDPPPCQIQRTIASGITAGARRPRSVST